MAVPSDVPDPTNENYPFGNYFSQSHISGSLSGRSNRNVLGSYNQTITKTYNNFAVGNHGGQVGAGGECISRFPEIFLAN